MASASIADLVTQMRENVDAIHEKLATLHDTKAHDEEIERLENERQRRIDGLKEKRDKEASDLADKRKAAAEAAAEKRRLEREQIEERRQRESDELAEMRRKEEEEMMARRQREDEERQKKLAEEEEELKATAQREEAEWQALQDEEEEKLRLQAEEEENGLVDEIDAEMVEKEEEMERKMAEGQRALQELDERRKAINAMIDAQLSTSTTIPSFRRASKRYSASPIAANVAAMLLNGGNPSNSNAELKPAGNEPVMTDRPDQKDLPQEDYQSLSRRDTPTIEEEEEEQQDAQRHIPDAVEEAAIGQDAEPVSEEPKLEEHPVNDNDLAIEQEETKDLPGEVNDGIPVSEQPQVNKEMEQEQPVTEELAEEKQDDPVPAEDSASDERQPGSEMPAAEEEMSGESPASHEEIGEIEVPAQALQTPSEEASLPSEETGITPGQVETLSPVDAIPRDLTLSAQAIPEEYEDEHNGGDSPAQPSAPSPLEFFQKDASETPPPDLSRPPSNRRGSIASIKSFSSMRSSNSSIHQRMRSEDREDRRAREETERINADIMAAMMANERAAESESGSSEKEIALATAAKEPEPEPKQASKPENPSFTFPFFSSRPKKMKTEPVEDPEDVRAREEMARINAEIMAEALAAEQEEAAQARRVSYSNHRKSTSNDSRHSSSHEDPEDVRAREEMARLNAEILAAAALEDAEKERYWELQREQEAAARRAAEDPVTETDISRQMDGEKPEIHSVKEWPVVMHEHLPTWAVQAELPVVMGSHGLLQFRDGGADMDIVEMPTIHEVEELEPTAEPEAARPVYAVVPHEHLPTWANQAAIPIVRGSHGQIKFKETGNADLVTVHAPLIEEAEILVEEPRVSLTYDVVKHELLPTWADQSSLDVIRGSHGVLVFGNDGADMKTAQASQEPEVEAVNPEVSHSIQAYDVVKHEHLPTWADQSALEVVRGSHGQLTFGDGGANMATMQPSQEPKAEEIQLEEPQSLQTYDVIKHKLLPTWTNQSELEAVRGSHGQLKFGNDGADMEVVQAYQEPEIGSSERDIAHSMPTYDVVEHKLLPTWANQSELEVVHGSHGQLIFDNSGADMRVVIMLQHTEEAASRAQEESEGATYEVLQHGLLPTWADQSQLSIITGSHGQLSFTDAGAVVDCKEYLTEPQAAVLPDERNDLIAEEPTRITCDVPQHALLPTWIDQSTLHIVTGMHGQIIFADSGAEMSIVASLKDIEEDDAKPEPLASPGIHGISVDAIPPAFAPAAVPEALWFGKKSRPGHPHNMTRLDSVEDVVKHMPGGFGRAWSSSTDGTVPEEHESALVKENESDRVPEDAADIILLPREIGVIEEGSELSDSEHSQALVTNVSAVSESEVISDNDQLSDQGGETVTAEPEMFPQSYDEHGKPEEIDESQSSEKVLEIDTSSNIDVEQQALSASESIPAGATEESVAETSIEDPDFAATEDSPTQLPSHIKQGLPIAATSSAIDSPLEEGSQQTEPTSPTPKSPDATSPASPSNAMPGHMKTRFPFLAQRMAAKQAEAERQQLPQADNPSLAASNPEEPVVVEQTPVALAPTVPNGLGSATINHGTEMVKLAVNEVAPEDMPSEVIEVAGEVYVLDHPALEELVHAVNERESTSDPYWADQAGLDIIRGAHGMLDFSDDKVSMHASQMSCQPHPYWTADQSELSVLRGHHGTLRFEDETATSYMESDMHHEPGTAEQVNDNQKESRMILEPILTKTQVESAVGDNLGLTQSPTIATPVAEPEPITIEASTVSQPDRYWVDQAALDIVRGSHGTLLFTTSGAELLAHDSPHEAASKQAESLIASAEMAESASKPILASKYWVDQAGLEVVNGSHGRLVFENDGASMIAHVLVPSGCETEDSAEPDLPGQSRIESPNRSDPSVASHQDDPMPSEDDADILVRSPARISQSLEGMAENAEESSPSTEEHLEQPQNQPEPQTKEIDDEAHLPVDDDSDEYSEEDIENARLAAMDKLNGQNQLSDSNFLYNDENSSHGIMDGYEPNASSAYGHTDEDFHHDAGRHSEMGLFNDDEDEEDQDALENGPQRPLNYSRHLSSNPRSSIGPGAFARLLNTVKSNVPAVGSAIDSPQGSYSAISGPERGSRRESSIHVRTDTSDTFPDSIAYGFHETASPVTPTDLVSPADTNGHPVEEPAIHSWQDSPNRHDNHLDDFQPQHDIKPLASPHATQNDFDTFNSQAYAPALLSPAGIKSLHFGRVDLHDQDAQQSPDEQLHLGPRSEYEHAESNQQEPARTRVPPLNTAQANRGIDSRSARPEFERKQSFTNHPASRESRASQIPSPSKSISRRSTISDRVNMLNQAAVNSPPPAAVPGGNSIFYKTRALFEHASTPSPPPATTRPPSGVLHVPGLRSKRSSMQQADLVPDESDVAPRSLDGNQRPPSPGYRIPNRASMDHSVKPEHEHTPTNLKSNNPFLGAITQVANQLPGLYSSMHNPAHQEAEKQSLLGERENA